MPVTDTNARLQTYLSGSGWVILDDNNQPVLRTFSDDTGDEVAAVVRQYNDLRAEVERLQAKLDAYRTMRAQLNREHEAELRATETLPARNPTPQQRAGLLVHRLLIEQAGSLDGWEFKVEIDGREFKLTIEEASVASPASPTEGP